MGYKIDETSERVGRRNKCYHIVKRECKMKLKFKSAAELIKMLLHFESDVETGIT